MSWGRLSTCLPLEGGSMLLKDKYGRKIRKLRVSLLDACNFRCFYCMPLNPKFRHHSQLLKPIEIENICRELVGYGIEQIRITGGEPTVRRDFQEIVSRIAQLPIAKLGLTSNGLLLANHFDFLKDHNCININISLDSLSAKKFHQITRTSSFDQVLQTILQAQEMGFNLKINTILMKGFNDDEIIDFVEFSAKYEIEVRFLEMMRIGQIRDKQASMFISAATAIEQIEEKYTLKPVVGQEVDSTSFNFTSENGAHIGFIASESRPFCGACSRWRLSPTGTLRACLMSEKGINLRGLEQQQLQVALSEVLEMKPIGRIKELNQDMHQIGG